jgi:hypothetical protein
MNMSWGKVLYMNFVNAVHRIVVDLGYHKLRHSKYILTLPAQTIEHRN